MYDFNGALDAIENVTPGELGRQLASPPYAEFDAQEYAQRAARLGVLLKRDGVEAALLTQQENVRYFSGYLSVLWISRFRPLTFLLPVDASTDAALIVSGQERGNAEATSWAQDVIAYSPQVSPIDFIAQAIRSRGLGKSRLAIELGFGQRLGMNQEQWAELQAALPEVEWVDVTMPVQCVRMLKSQAEIDRLAQSSRISCEGVAAGFRALKVGMTEREILSVMAAEMFRLGAEVGTKPAFFGIQAGDRWMQSNALASDYALKSGDVVLVDGGATYKGYVTDFIRQAAIGPISDAFKETFDVAVECNRACLSTVRPGALASDVYQAAADFLEVHKLQEHFKGMNIVGHGLGADVHELPWLGEPGVVFSSETRLREGMFLAIEPALKIRDSSQGPVGAYIVEENLEVTADGYRVVTDAMSPDLWQASA